MITNLLTHVSQFILHVIDVLGYAGVGLLMAIESAAIPLPSEIIMPFAGFLAASGRFSLVWLAVVGALGSALGSGITYSLGYFGGRKLIEKYGHYVFLSQNELEFTEKFFRRFKHAANYLGRVIPVVRTFISIPAGIAKTPFVPFFIASFLGSFIWSFFLAWLGLKLGENWKILETYFHKFDLIIIVLIILGVIYLIYSHRRQNKHS
ncbi:MAG TPA: DedA family protein [Methylomirabilota bacterium]|nr:DedA family protein [Methylomirabilota bacterium]